MPEIVRIGAFKLLMFFELLLLPSNNLKQG
jgi:hypothetical protein